MAKDMVMILLMRKEKAANRDNETALHTGHSNDNSSRSPRHIRMHTMHANARSPVGLTRPRTKRAGARAAIAAAALHAARERCGRSGLTGQGLES